MRFDDRYMPLWLFQMEPLHEILNIESNELDRLQSTIESYRKQLRVSTADFLLSAYERDLNLSGKGLTIEERRKNIIAKRNARYKCTKKNIINVLSEMTGLQVDVIEHIDEYYFTVQMVQNNLSDSFVASIKSYLDMIKPAHIGYDLSLIKYDESSIHAGIIMIESSIINFKEVNLNGI